MIVCCGFYISETFTCTTSGLTQSGYSQIYEVVFLTTTVIGGLIIFEWADYVEWGVWYKRDSTDFHTDFKNIYGVDLSDYFIDKSSYNPVVYIHKKYLPKENCNGLNIQKRINCQENKDKSQQFDYDKTHCETYRTKIINGDYKDPVIEQTIRFAKDIIPITIPPSTNLADPVYYTIKSCKKTKRKYESQDYNIEREKDATFDKEKSKHTIGFVKQGKCKRNKDSLSATSITHLSPNNTIDDMNENQSLSYSLSEMSDRKIFKKDETVKKSKKLGSQRMVASESFEAIATEYGNTSSDTKIKIHLMHEKEKQLFCDNIRSPVLKAIKECFSELNTHRELTTEIEGVNKILKCHASKLDNILDKLTCIDNKLEMITKNQLRPIHEVGKASKLEELGQDILNVREDLSSEEELACVNFSTKSRGKNTPVSPRFSEKDAERDVENVDNLARGENIPQYFKASTSQLDIKPERSNRIPTRFCWTDATMKN